jgi:isopropylmalate/homocitrate/citramalate synthase
MAAKGGEEAAEAGCDSVDTTAPGLGSAGPGADNT